MNVALIPARGGSKSIHKKNIVKLGNYPLIYYTIYVAQKTKLIDRIIVSTDDFQIKEISCSFGAEVPFIRPKSISNDDAGDYEVVDHMLKWITKNDENIPDHIIYLRPDFPFRTVKTLNNAIKRFIHDEKADGLRSIKISQEIPYKMWKIKNNYLVNVLDKIDIKEPHNSARQLFPQTYYPIGYIEIYKTQIVLNNKTLKGKKIIPFIIQDEIINIGSQKDLEKAKSRINNFQFD